MDYTYGLDIPAIVVGSFSTQINIHIKRVVYRDENKIVEKLNLEYILISVL